MRPWQAGAALLVTLACGACSGSSSRSQDGPKDAANDGFETPGNALEGVPAVPDEAFPEGACGGFEQLRLAAPEPLLGGRLTLRPITGLANLERPHSIMAAPWAAESETRLYLEGAAGKKLVVFTEELFRRPVADLAGVVKKLDPYAKDAFVGSFPSGSLKTLAVVPRRLVPDEEKALVLRLYAISPDDLLIRVSFYVSPEVVAEGQGCSALARDMSKTLEAGDRKIDAAGGRRDLDAGLSLEVPPGVVLVTEQGPDFTVYRAYPLSPFGGTSGAFNIYVGGHPQPVDGPNKIPGTLLGSKVDWIDADDGTAHARQAVAPIPGTNEEVAHVFFVAGNEAIFGSFVKMADSLRAKR
ncbi:MAG: hypothetical protein U0271_20455 [Polyangiaceae bacterium]